MLYLSTTTALDEFTPQAHITIMRSLLNCNYWMERGNNKMEKKDESSRFRIGRISFALLSSLLVCCIVAQVFLAGLAVFVNPSNWAFHEGFVHFFEIIPVLMLVMSFVGKLPRWALWQSLGIFGLIFVMYFTANITSVLPWAAAAHPVIAIMLFWLSVIVHKRAWRMTFKPKQVGSV